jgi:hypothetical protein
MINMSVHVAFIKPHGQTAFMPQNRISPFF